MMKKKECIEASRELINDDNFRSRHRTSDRYFTRCRKLTFVVMMMLLLRKSVKSLQCVIMAVTPHPSHLARGEPIPENGKDLCRFDLTHVRHRH